MPDPVEPPIGQRVRRVLLVEDEEDIRLLMGELLETGIPGVQVVGAPTGAEALRLLEGGNFHLIITDYKMPGMTGLDFLAGARAKAPDVPRILMTAFPDLDVAVRAINEAHIENFFSKPVEPEEVLDKVRRVLDLHEAKSQRERAFARSVNLLAERLGNKPS